MSGVLSLQKGQETEQGPRGIDEVSGAVDLKDLIPTGEEIKLCLGQSFAARHLGPTQVEERYSPAGKNRFRRFWGAGTCGEWRCDPTI